MTHPPGASRDVPFTLDLIVQEAISPAESLATDRMLLDAVVASPGRGTLRVYTLAGDCLSLGRYHLAPGPRPEAGVRLWRRWSGGRAMPWGDGFAAVSLVLPHRSALVSSDALALAPEQVMNRCVRGILGACEGAGVPAFYPGRDTVTVEGRLLGIVSFEVTATGALVFEAVLANGRDASVLPELLDRADPAGVVPAAMLTPADVTSLAARLGRALTLREIAEGCRRGYEDRLGVAVVDRVPATGAAFDAAAWLASRRPRPDLDRRFSTHGQLGLLELHFARDGARIRDVMIAGDLIASSETVARIERTLRGAAVDHAETAVLEVLREPGAFVLGLGPATDLAATIAAGIAA